MSILACCRDLANADDRYQECWGFKKFFALKKFELGTVSGLLQF
jgi:hypothetical protein